MISKLTIIFNKCYLFGDRQNEFINDFITALQNEFNVFIEIKVWHSDIPEAGTVMMHSTSKINLDKANDIMQSVYQKFEGV